jgi:3D (Asp-Asp-Asp) domain-containing protein
MARFPAAIRRSNRLAGRWLRFGLPLACALALAACAPGSAPELEFPAPRATRSLFLPLLQHQAGPLAVAAPLEPQRRASQALHLPLLAAQRVLLGEAATTPAPSTPNLLAVELAPAATPAPQGPAADTASCKVYPHVRVTWYELGSCCDKAPGHPQYGITRSGLPVEWGMAAVQARVPLLPMGTRFIVRDLGPEYVFVVADTGSEMAFGSSWVDIYAPTIPVGHWVERQVADGRSDLLVCPQHN